MISGSFHNGAAVTAALDALESAFDAAAKLRFDALTTAEKLSVLQRFEQIVRRIPAVEHTLIAGLTASFPTEIGATSWREALSIRLSISRTEARRRLSDAEKLGPRTALTGEPLEPMLAVTAQAQSAGTIGYEHVRIVRDFNTATVSGDRNVANAGDGDNNTATVTGDDSFADAGPGNGNTATVTGDNSQAQAGVRVAFVPGDSNTAIVDGDASTALAGPCDNNTAIVTGDGLTADTGPGDGNTVVVPPPGG